MKVLALVVLVIAVSGLEAGVVKREIPNIPSFDDISQMMKTFSETVKTQVEDLVAKFQSPELQSQYGGYLDQAKANMEPLRSKMEQWISDLQELGKKSS